MDKWTSLSELAALFDLRPIRGDRYGATDPDDMKYARAVGDMLRDVQEHLGRLAKFQPKLTVVGARQPSGDEPYGPRSEDER